jgi:hypothetical protein
VTQTLTLTDNTQTKRRIIRRVAQGLCTFELRVDLACILILLSCSCWRLSTTTSLLLQFQFSATRPYEQIVRTNDQDKHVRSTGTRLLGSLRLHAEVSFKERDIAAKEIGHWSIVPHHQQGVRYLSKAAVTHRMRQNVREMCGDKNEQVE